MAGSWGGSTDRFVGRARELVRAKSWLLDALAGHGGLVLCTGDAGIGKTRLAEELAASAVNHGAVVVWARSTDPGSSPPYGLWRLVVDELVSRSAETWSALREALERPTPSDGLEPGSSQRFALFAMLRTALRQSACDTGLVLVLDDLQWADEASTVLLADVARQLRGNRILIFATARTAGDSDDELPAVAADSDVQRVNLTGLPRDPVSELLTLTGLSATPDRVEWILEQTGGNPFLVRELAQLLAETGSAVTSVPGRVVDATTYRVGRLSDRAQTLLRAAAVAGNGFSIGVVAKMLGQPLLALLEPFDECRAAGFLVTGDRRGDYRFSHALVQSAVVVQLREADRRRLHTAAADAIEELFAGQLRPRLAEIAGHRVEASLPGDRASAVAACAAAADAANEMLAYEDAVRLYREALLVGGPELDREVRVDLELGLAFALYRSGDLPGWWAVAVEVGQRAERGRDWTSLARAALVLDATGEPEWDIELCRMSEVALDSHGLPLDLAARVSCRYAQALAYRGLSDQAREVSNDALLAAQSSHDTTALIEALHARQLACSASDGVAERTVLAARMLETATAAGSTVNEMWGRLWRIDTLFETGRLALLRDELVGLDLCAQRLGGPLSRFHYLEASATLSLATGRYGDARRYAEEAFQLMDGMGHPVAFGACSTILGQAGLHVGFDASGLTALWQSLPAKFQPERSDSAQKIASVFPALTAALMCLQRGDRLGAETAYAHAGPPRSWAPNAALLLACWAHGLPVAIGLGRAVDIEFLAARFEPFRRQHVANGAGVGTYMGPVELQLGKAAAALGRLDAAVDDLRSAVDACAANGARGYGVESATELAAALLRREEPGDRAEALRLLDATSPEAERLEMAPFIRRITALRVAPTTTDPESPLSRRELQVVQLVARGLTNRQIAEELFVSERTAENHVQHILAKLGLRNRTQIATWSGATTK
jgi:DNA-binding CsgD family transcriptional regulator/tetratricopeptide (TPR) repeat protein